MQPDGTIPKVFPGYVYDRKFPSESAFQGYDAMMLIGKSNFPGTQNPGTIGDHEGLYSTYRFIKVNGMNENQFIHMVRYESYKFVEAE